MTRKRSPRSKKARMRGEARIVLSRKREDELKVYSYREEEIENALAQGKDTERLKAYFGERRYEELRKLAQEARRRSVRGGPRVLILPGTMGSTIGKPGAIINDVLWFDPIDIIAGNLPRLALNGSDGLTALGIIPLAYTELKLRLRIEGFDADFHYYDWRQSLHTLGEGLIRRLNSEASGQISLVAHSMGGLVARAAIGMKASKIRRLVMLGTPNQGSFGPAQVIRGVYPVVKQVAALDPFHTAEELAATVFNTFPGLYQMLPTRNKFSGINFYDAGEWPSQGPRPRQSLLNKVESIQQSLAQADERFFLIAGINQDTVVNLKLEDDEFVYEHSLDGDGTVPLALAELSGAKSYYIRESHGSLPNNETVAHAVTDILKNGETAALPDKWAPIHRGVRRSIREPELRAPMYGDRKGNELTTDEIRHILEPLVSPDAHDQRGETAQGVTSPVVVGEDDEQNLSRIVVRRRRQHRIDVRLALGSITEVDARAYVLGIYRNIAPTGPAQDLDLRMGGAIKDFTVRRMFGGNVGEIFIMPTGRHRLAADFIIFAGLGDFDQFTDATQELTAEHVIRTSIRTGIEEFATVLLGAGSGKEIRRSLRNLMTGFFRGLMDADQDHWFRRVTICELDPEKYGEIKRELLHLANTDLFSNVEVTIDEVILRSPSVPAVSRHVEREADPIYLLIKQEGSTKASLTYRSSVLTPGARATVITDLKSIGRPELEAHLKTIESSAFTLKVLETFGEELSRLVLADRIRAVLPEMRDRHLVVVHDAPSSRIPWEAIRLDGWYPALGNGLSRRYVADNLSVAKWIKQRQQATTLTLLLVINPTEDLDGAEAEGQRIRNLFAADPSVKLDQIRGPQATKAALLQRFRSGEYDVVHYAGHAFFDPNNPARSGILCKDKEVLSGSDMAGVGNLPSLVFFNACESGRVRRGLDRNKKQLEIEKRLERAVGLAEAFLRGGIANYLGTYWPVGDDAAKAFAETFYTGLLKGQTIGAALLAGRERVRTEARSVDWADYIHYGSSDFVLKEA
jgi:pimeloyl-ACP methyl ester carboxylesterase